MAKPYKTREHTAKQCKGAVEMIAVVLAEPEKRDGPTILPAGNFAALRAQQAKNMEGKSNAAH